MRHAADAAGELIDSVSAEALQAQTDYVRSKLGKDWSMDSLSQIPDLLKLQECMTNEPFVLVLIFTKGYKKWLGRVACDTWCFKLVDEPFRKKYDAIVAAGNIQGKMWSFFTSSKGLPR